MYQLLLDLWTKMTSEKRMPSEDARICVVGRLRDDAKLLLAVGRLGLPTVFSEDGAEYVDDAKYDTGFLLAEFEGDIYERLRKSDFRLPIWGPTIIYQCIQDEQALPFNVRPLFCNAMQNLIVCFTGFRKKEELSLLVDLVHHMGGSIRKEISTKVTHLVANSTNNEKYKYAVTLGIPIMSNEWVLKMWEKRYEVDYKAATDDLSEHRLLPFFSCRICFVGFAPEEERHVVDLTLKNGGKVNKEFESCTHIVVEDETESDMLENFPPKVYVVKPEWFWASIQMDACAEESMYFYKQTVESPRAKVNNGLNVSGSRHNKRKRLKETVGQLALVPEVEQHRLSTNELGSSFNESLLDATASPDKSLDISYDKRRTLSPNGLKSPIDVKSLTARHQVCLELLQTEINYVNILNTIVKLFKDPLENADQVGGPLLNPTEVKIIFSNLPPIFEVHNKLCHDLSALLNNWQEDCSVGDTILKHSHEIFKAYPPFVNFFEKTKEMLIACDQNKPRFHAFLKICQSKPECGRQSLVELMIRPVQRLPSIILLLNDILKHTNKNNPDYQHLENAIKSVKEVLTNINEDKRKTEGQVAMFDIINDIENCPANLLSSHRSFVTKADMIELSNSISGKGDNLSMFLFTDSLEICKRRSKMIGILKSPNTLNLQSVKGQSKCYKHIELMPLSHIKRVVDIKETEECKQVFALVCRSNEEMKDKLFTFALIGPEMSKLQFLKTVCRHIANTICRPDAESFLTFLEPDQLNIETSEISTSSLSKAMRRWTLPLPHGPLRFRRKAKAAASGLRPQSLFERARPSNLVSRLDDTNKQ